MKSTIVVKISGMSCVMCSRTVEQALSKIDGIYSSTVDFTTGRAEILLDPSIVSEQTIRKAIEHAGYRFVGTSGNAGREDELTKHDLFWKKLRFSIGLTSGTIAMVLMYLPLPAVFPLQYILFALTTPVFLFISYPIFSAAFHALKNAVLTMDVMYAMGIGISYLSSVLGTFGILPHEFMYYETALFLSSFLMLGRFLEARARGKTSDAIRKLMKLQPAIAHRVVDDTIIDISYEEIHVGDILIVKPGEAIPADGSIVSGETSIDQSMLTGEPLPVYRGPGDAITGGCINLDGSFTMRAERTGNDTVLQRIIRIVEEAQGSKPALQKLADSVVGYFIPVILMIAIAVFAIWFFILNASASFAIARLISVLVIACPCALGLATPTAVTAGIGRGATLGILIKHSEALELSERITTVVFDKTGTLTTGTPEVRNVHTENFPENEMIALAAGLESHASHPIARAIVQYALTRDIASLTFPSVSSESGMGVFSTIHNKEVCAGSIRFLRNRGYTASETLLQQAKKSESIGHTAIFVGNDHRAIGLFEISDTLRPYAKETIAALKNMGIRALMITGDNRRAAGSVATSLGIDEAIAEVLPEEKAEKIRALQNDGEQVAFVGDGINDAPALAVADIGIALAAATDIALEAGSVVVLTNDLRDVLSALTLGKKTARRIRQNIFWAFAYNILLIPVAAGALYPLWGITLKPELAGLAMALSSVTVVTLSLGLTRYSPRRNNSLNS